MKTVLKTLTFETAFETIMDQNQSFPEFYVTTPLPCPYLKAKFEQKLFTHLTADKNAHQFNELHLKGFRRSQTIAYKHQCEGCNACISVRLLVDEFKPSKNQKRILARNKHIIAERTGPTATAAQYSLFRDYVAHRHSGGGMADMSVYDYQAMIEETAVDTFMIEYYQPIINASGTTSKQLVAAALCDKLEDGISMVYSFFDVEQSSKSLGSYMILDVIGRAQAAGLAYVYLGYWVKGSRKMDYKINYKPQEHLMDGTWTRVHK